MKKGLVIILPVIWSYPDDWLAAANVAKKLGEFPEH